MTTQTPQRPFGATGRCVAVIGQGSWKLEEANRAAAIASLTRGLDLGMTHIDTAEYYGYGKAESLIAAAITGRRDEVFLVSKVMPQNASRKGVREACERSLKFLGTDRIDCYLLHWRGSHPLERAIEHRVIPWCIRNGVAVVAYTPFGPEPFLASETTPGSAVGRVLTEIAGKHSATLRQIALAFVIRQAPVFAIPKASTVEHVEENAAAGAVRLSTDDIRQLEAAFPLGDEPASLPMI